MSLAALSVGLELIRATMRPLLPLMGGRSAAFYGVIVLNTTAMVVIGYHAMYRFPPAFEQAASGLPSSPVCMSAPVST